MKESKMLNDWRAQEIAKVYLLGTNLVALIRSDRDIFDFLAVGTKRPNRQIGIEVKATKYSEAEIRKVFTKTRRTVAHSDIPVMLMYIDYDTEKGYFEIRRSNLNTDGTLQNLNNNTLKAELTRLIK